MALYRFGANCERVVTYLHEFSHQDAYMDRRVLSQRDICRAKWPRLAATSRSPMGQPEAVDIAGFFGPSSPNPSRPALRKDARTIGGRR
jgi:hypothetical protein